MKEKKRSISFFPVSQWNLSQGGISKPKSKHTNACAHKLNLCTHTQLGRIHTPHTHARASNPINFSVFISLVTIFIYCCFAAASYSYFAPFRVCDRTRQFSFKSMAWMVLMVLPMLVLVATIAFFLSLCAAIHHRSAYWKLCNSIIIRFFAISLFHSGFCSNRYCCCQFARRSPTNMAQSIFIWKSFIWIVHFFARCRRRHLAGNSNFKT